MTQISKIMASICLLANVGARADLIHIPGKVANFPQLSDGDVVDAAFVIPSLRPLDVLQFQFDKLLSPDEEMSAGPIKAKVPGNFYIPKQTKSWGFFPITFQKETFTFTTENNLDQEISTLYAQAPFSKMIDVLQNHAPFTEVLKLVTLKGFGFEGNKNPFAAILDRR